MRLNVTFKSNYVVDAVMGALKPESRTDIYAVAGRAVMNAVQRHIRSYMRTKHTTANMLGARPTGHYEKGAAAITSTADSSGAVVRIPIPGIDRAWNDIQIRPGPGKEFLTLPKAAISYGRKVREVRALGYSVFRPAAKGAKMTQKSPRKYSAYQNILMGSKNGDTQILYTLVGGVLQRRDPSLLPSQGEIAETGWKAIWRRIQAAVAKARQGGAK